MYSFYFNVFIILVNLLKNTVVEAAYREIISGGGGGEQTMERGFLDFGEITNTTNEPKKRSSDCQGRNKLSIFDARIDNMPPACYRSACPKDCASATQCTQRSGIYIIEDGQYHNSTFYVVCDEETQNGDWLVIHRRQDGSENFYRDWSDYENGFGDIEGEFFIGLKKLHILTNYNGPQELLVVMEDLDYTEAYAKYSSFAIDDEKNAYALRSIGKYSGTAGDSMQHQVGMKFTTKDRDNDLKPEYNCAVEFRGAWWHNECHRSNPNGNYNDNSFGKGINWYHFRGHNLSLPYIKMMIRRRKVA